MKTEQTLAASNGSAENTALRFRPPGAPGSTTLGITDGTSTEIVLGDLEAGQAVLIGLESAAPTTTIPGPGFRL